jgi:hypothetical protein
MLSIIGKDFKTENIGKMFSNSKKRFTWVVEINDVENNIVLTLSFVSRKYEIFVNGFSQKKGSEVMGTFSHEFRLGECLFRLESSFSEPTLKVNGTLFQSLPKNKLSHVRRPTEQGHQIINNRTTNPRTL